MKKNTKTLYWILTLMVAVSLLAVGCSSNQPTDHDTNKGQASADDAQKEPVTLKFTFWGSTYEKKAMEQAIAQFEEKYKYIKVDAQHIPADYETKLAAMVAGDEAPDIGYVRDWMALPWAEEGKFYNIFDFIDNDPNLKKEDFLDEAFIYYEPGKSSGLYTAMEAYGLFYNKDMFKDAGVPDLPTKDDQALTWDQFVDVAKKLTIDQNGKNADDPQFNKDKIKQYGVSFSPDYTNYMTMVFSAGGDYISDDNQSFGLAEPEGIDAIQKMADLINKYHVAPSPAVAKSIPAGAASLQTKQVAILLSGQWALLDLGKSGINFGVGILPKIKVNATSTATGTNSIFKSTKHPEEAYLFWKWLTDPATSLDLMADGLWMPLMKNWYTDPALVSKWAEIEPAHPDGYKDAIMNMSLNHTKKLPSAYVRNFTKINALVQPTIERIYFGELTAEQGLKEIEPSINQLIAGRYDQ